MICSRKVIKILSLWNYDTDNLKALAKLLGLEGMDARKKSIGNGLLKKGTSNILRGGFL